jgi:photosystem II PsbT protein
LTGEVGVIQLELSLLPAFSTTQRKNNFSSFVGKIVGYETKIILVTLGILIMEAVAYILVLAMALSVLFFAIAFREPPRIEK